jgi:hypothetical protein
MSLQPLSYLPTAVQIKLDLPMTAAGEAGTSQRIIFEKDVRQDLSNACGLSSEHFCITKIAPGSILLDIEIWPDIAGGSSEHVAQSLVVQVHDPRSRLRAGSLTQYVTSITFHGGVDVAIGTHQLPKTPVATPSPGSNGIIIRNNLPVPSTMESPAHVQVSQVSKLSKHLDALPQVTEHSSWTAKDMKRSEEVYKTFDDEVRVRAHSVTVGEQKWSKTREQAQWPIVGAVHGAQIERTEDESKRTLESMILERMLKQVNIRRQGYGSANDHFITFSPSAVCSVATLFCNACSREALSELWQELQKTCSIRSLSEVNEEHLARSRVIGSCRYGACSQLNIKYSIWIPKDRRVQKRFLELSQHFYLAEIFCRYA